MDSDKKVLRVFDNQVDDVRKLREMLCKERKKNYEIQRQLEQVKHGNKTKDSFEKKYKNIKGDHSQLLSAFEKSEQIRREQKDLILSLKRENAKLRK